MSVPEADVSPEHPDTDELRFWIEFVYQHCLGRSSVPDGADAWMPALRSGMSFSAFAQSVAGSAEAAQYRRSAAGFPEISDGEFIVSIAELLFQGRGATARDVEIGKAYLAEDPAQRPLLIARLISEHIARQKSAEVPWHDAGRCLIMGTDRFLTRQIWDERARELGGSKAIGTTTVPAPAQAEFRHTGNHVVSAIASLYRGGNYIEAFLRNITSQSFFDRSELIIIDADSPEGEYETIARYQEVYPNIVYKRINYRIGVYDAWNVGVEMARGRYLTNTNMDDLRRSDSFEIQANALERNPSAEIVYQDFFYSLDSSLDFEDVARFNFKSDLPLVTPHNLLAVNLPHNAPMWRRSLHDRVGLFDTSFKSAGDYEFWMRSLTKVARFHKINDPHVVYFNNPAGISTRPDTRGIEEARQILNRYSRKLISPRLMMSREDFARHLGIPADWPAGQSCYDVVHGQLKSLGEQRR